MSWEILFLAVVAILVVLMIAFRKNPIVKKYWKYTLILAPIVLLVILKVINDLKRKGLGGDGTVPGTATVDPIIVKIDSLKEDLVEAQQVSAIEIAAAKAKNAEKLKELETVTKITDKSERRKRLAAMIG